MHIKMAAVRDFDLIMYTARMPMKINREVCKRNEGNTAMPIQPDRCSSESKKNAMSEAMMRFLLFNIPQT
jgi:hypothetical protein